MEQTIVQADCIDFLGSLPADSVDLVFGSPPYELGRLYLENGKSTNSARPTEEWVAWMVKVYHASLRVCRGLVAFVVEGQTKDYRYSCGPALLMADLHRAGVNLRRPCFFHRVGIPGSGGPDWLRGDTEFIICATRPGRLPWSDNTAMGHLPKWAPGGEMSSRVSDGTRRNQWGSGENSIGRERQADGSRCANGTKPSHKIRTKSGIRDKSFHQPDGDKEHQSYDPPAIANPGNLIHCEVGGGQMGSPFAHQNEAPFPEKLAEFFVLSFCPPGGLCVDPFSGSGTTAAVCKRHSRNFSGCDLRQSQVDLGLKRLELEATQLFSGLEAVPCP